MCTHQCTASTNTSICAHQVLSLSAFCVAQLLQQPPSQPIRTCRCRLELANNAAPQAELLSPLFFTEAKTHAACAAFARSCRPFLRSLRESKTITTSRTSSSSPTCSAQPTTTGSFHQTSCRPTSLTNLARLLCLQNSLHTPSTRCRGHYRLPHRLPYGKVHATRGGLPTITAAAWGPTGRDLIEVANDLPGDSGQISFHGPTISTAGSTTRRPVHSFRITRLSRHRMSLQRHARLPGVPASYL